ncbi:MAG: Cna B-type domain-containing protein, partial [Clostridia bacterium]|nr:Cna B-type domain-containing protein [Clostridia bacterium]
LKVWDDEDDQDGYRPDDVTVNLLADGKIIDTVTLSEENEWSYSWTKLDKKANGADIDYTVTENAVAEYTTNIVKKDANSFSYTVTNSHTTEETEASVKKVWDLTEKQIKKTPDSLTVMLLADGKDTGKQVVLTEQNKWTDTIKELPKFRDHGQEIVYTWSEEALPAGYELTGTTKEGTITTLTNTYSVKPTRQPLEVTKILSGRKWGEDDQFEFVLAADENNPEGATLPATTVKYATKDKQTVVFDDITFNKYGTFKFTITESEGEKKGIGYDTESKEFTIVVSDDGEGSLVVTDITNAGKIIINNPYESKGEIQFFANKELVGRTLKEGEFWFELQDEEGNMLQQKACDAEGKVTFDPITYSEEDMVVGGEIVTERKYTYTIREVNKTDKKVIYDGAVKTIDVTLKDDQEGCIEATAPEDQLTITFINVVAKVRKTDLTDADHKPLEGAEISVLDEAGETVFKFTSGKEPTEIENLEVEKKYTLHEVFAPIDYNLTADTTFTVHKDGTITHGDRTLSKGEEILIEDKPTEKPKFEKKIQDTNDTTGETSGWQDSADYDIGDAVPYRLTATLADNVTDYNQYYITFHDEMEDSLDFNDISHVYLNGKEVSEKDYQLTKDKHKFTLTMKWGDGEKRITDETLNLAKVEVFFTATLNDKAAFGAQGNVNTGWLEYSNNPRTAQDGKAGEETEKDSVIAFTYKVEVNKTDKEKKPLAGAEFKLEKKIAGDGLKLIQCVKGGESGEIFTFNGLDDGTYVLTETKKPDGYKKLDPITFTVTAGHTTVWEGEERTTILTSLTVGDVYLGTLEAPEITFTPELTMGIMKTYIKNEPELVTATVKKVWNDDENRDGLRALSVTVELLADGNGTGKYVTLNEAGNWIGQITGLDKMKNDQPIKYTWKEVTNVPFYTLTDNSTNGTLTTLTNTHETGETSVGVRKVWADNDNKAEKRPSSIAVQLYADEKAVGTPIILDGSNDWSYTWTKLDKNSNPSGRTGEQKEIKYTVAETNIPDGYTAKISGNASAGYVITNTYEIGKLILEKEFDIEPWDPYTPDDSPRDIPVIKVWNDNDNQDGNRPKSITVRLLADGVEVASAKLTAKNGWKTVFTGLPRLTEEKEKIEYTITEDPVEWYETEIHGFTIRNNYKPELTSVSVKKVWQDRNNALRQRPASIVMTLSNGMTVVLNEQNNWEATITDLPTRVNGQPVTYTWTEQNVLGYTLTDVTVKGNLTTFTNELWKRPEHGGGKKPKTPGTPVEYIDEYETPLGVEIVINHVGDCFD